MSETSQAGMMQIGEVADRVGLSLRTVRYYEEMGLLAPEKRTDGGFRLYTDAHVDRLNLIKRMKPLGFTVPEMRQLLEARAALAEPDTDDSAREEARDLLAGFATAAARRCDELRAQLESAETLARQLRRESRSRARRTAKH